jgi:antitoxin YefM
METTTYSNFRARLKQKLDRITSNHDLLIVNRKGDRKDVVVMSLDDYNSLQETLFLLSSKNNAKRLFESIDQLKKRKLSKRSLRLYDYRVFGSCVE